MDNCKNEDCFLIDVKNLNSKEKINIINSTEELNDLILTFILEESVKALKLKISEETILIIIMLLMNSNNNEDVSKTYSAAIALQKQELQNINFFHRYQKEILNQQIHLVQNMKEKIENKKDTVKGITFYHVLFSIF
jgi:hypothetical protein